MLNTLKELCGIYAVSGDEKPVEEYIRNKLNGIDGIDMQTDALGNLIVHKHGKSQPKNRVMLDAHMDEVGFIITSADTNGFLYFESVGGINESVLLGRRVTVGKQKIPGVIGLKPIHLLEGDEKTRLPEIKDMYIDIGATSQEEALGYVTPGDNAYFYSDFVCFGNGKIKSRAIDDRFGCALMLKLLSEEFEYDTWFSFSVREEIGGGGAATATFKIEPDYAVVLEATTAADIIDVEGAKRVCVQGDGPALSFMDRSTVYDKELYRNALETAKVNNIRCQSKTLVAGGNNAGAVHKNRSGVRTLAVSVPCRYLHSACCVADYGDMEEMYKLVKAVLSTLYNA